MKDSLLCCVWWDNIANATSVQNSIHTALLKSLWTLCPWSSLWETLKSWLKVTPSPCFKENPENPYVRKHAFSNEMALD